MNGTTLIDRVAQRAGVSRAEVRRVLGALEEVAAEAVAQGDRVSLPGLGTLVVRELAPRTIRNVSDMRKMMVGRRHTVRFRPASTLKEAVAGRTSQAWRQPEHQAAWRLAETLVADLVLYHGTHVPRLPARAADETVHQLCEGAFGPLWSRVLESYQARVVPDVRAEHDYLADAARHRWAA
ncbi:HU family DNA-binding protein [Myxococcota bacterium]|nr:HU family DNA-binding protein [Myxococcota bacterium]